MKNQFSLHKIPTEYEDRFSFSIKKDKTNLSLETIGCYKENDVRFFEIEGIVETLNKNHDSFAKDTTKLLFETVSKMVETLEYIVENEELNDNTHGWIKNDLDYVQVNFFRTNPDGDYQHEVRTETGISALDAINLLSVRIENTIKSNI